MELFRNLFEGYPNLWGGGVAHSVLILSLVIAFGIMLGKIKVAGISLGVTWILFVGIVFGHFNLNLDEHQSDYKWVPVSSQHSRKEGSH